VRYPDQPLTQQSIALSPPQRVADRLHPVDVGRSSNPAKALSRAVNPIPACAACRLTTRLPLRPFGVVREVGTELQEERTEAGVHGVEVAVVDEPDRHRHGPRVGTAGRVATLLDPNRFGFSCMRPRTTPPRNVGSLQPGQMLRITSSLRWPLSRFPHATARVAANRCIAALRRR
jgi:hypothetical protein